MRCSIRNLCLLFPGSNLCLCSCGLCLASSSRSSPVLGCMNLGGTTWDFDRNHQIGDVWYQTRLLDLQIWIILSHSHIHLWSCFWISKGQAENARAGVAVSGILQPGTRRPIFCQTIIIGNHRRLWMVSTGVPQWTPRLPLLSLLSAPGWQDWKILKLPHWSSTSGECGYVHRVQALNTHDIRYCNYPRCLLQCHGHG